MPPLQPLLSEQAAFGKHLFTQGYPLWNPDPDLLPQAHQRVGLRIGDVGTVDERGRFDVFFNILESIPETAYFPTNLRPIEDEARCGGSDILPREVVSSPETPWDVDQVEVLTVGGVTTTHYSATLSNDGAHIILPQGAQSFELELELRRSFEKCAREHGADWLERFRHRLGWPRSSSLYLLTGFHKTCSWSIASFNMQTAANTNPVGVYCTVMEVDERVMREDSVWQPAGRFKRKIGPPPDRQGQNNQTIFIRGFTITPNASRRGKSEQGQAGSLDMLSVATRFLSTLALAGDSTNTAETETPESNVVIQHVPQISQVSYPSEIINQYLLTKEPAAKIAVTHDSQWITILEEKRSWTLEDLENHFEALPPEHHTTYKDVVYLREPESSGPPTPPEHYSSPSPTHSLSSSSDYLGSRTPPQHQKEPLPPPKGPTGIHPLLAFHPDIPPIIYDVSLPPYMLFRDPRASIPAKALEEAATQPSMHTMSLVIDKFPWRLTIPPTKHYVSICDLLEALYRFLHLPVLPSEYNALPKQALKDEVSTAFRNRCGRAPSKKAADEQYQKGVKRVDFLRGRTRFMGLSGTKVGPDVWMLNLAS